MNYLCIFRSEFRGNESNARYLAVDANDVPQAIAALEEQMEREGESLSHITAIAPPHLMKIG